MFLPLKNFGNNNKNKICFSSFFNLFSTATISIIVILIIILFLTTTSDAQYIKIDPLLLKRYKIDLHNRNRNEFNNKNNHQLHQQQNVWLLTSQVNVDRKKTTNIAFTTVTPTAFSTNIFQTAIMNKQLPNRLNKQQLFVDDGSHVWIPEIRIYEPLRHNSVGGSSLHFNRGYIGIKNSYHSYHENDNMQMYIPYDYDNPELTGTFAILIFFIILLLLYSLE